MRRRKLNFTTSITKWLLLNTQAICHRTIVFCSRSSIIFIFESSTQCDLHSTKQRLKPWQWQNSSKTKCSLLCAKLNRKMNTPLRCWNGSRVYTKSDLKSRYIPMAIRMRATHWHMPWSQSLCTVEITSDSDYVLCMSSFFFSLRLLHCVHFSNGKIEMEELESDSIIFKQCFTLSHTFLWVQHLVCL